MSLISYACRVTHTHLSQGRHQSECDMVRGIHQGCSWQFCSFYIWRIRGDEHKMLKQVCMVYEERWRDIGKWNVEWNHVHTKTQYSAVNWNECSFICVVFPNFCERTRKLYIRIFVSVKEPGSRRTMDKDGVDASDCCRISWCECSIR